MSRDELKKAIDALPPLEAAAIRMRFGFVAARPYEHSNREIAKQLGISPSQARVLVDSGLHRLRKRHRQARRSA